MASYEIMIRPIKQLYQYAEDGDMSDVGVLAVSSYDINVDKLKMFGKNSLLALRFQCYFIRLQNSRNKYHSALAEYPCEAIKLAKGE